MLKWTYFFFIQGQITLKTWQISKFSNMQKCSEGYISEGNTLICFILVVKQYSETKYIADQMFCFAFMSYWKPPFLAHLAFRPCELLSSLFVRRLSSVINISHFNLLLRNHWANCNQTLVEWSLDGPLPKLCLVIPK
jgi:hypothetical protein